MFGNWSFNVDGAANGKLGFFRHLGILHDKSRLVMMVLFESSGN